MDEKIIFFNGFLKGVKDDARDPLLVEPERSVVGWTDEVVREFCLNDA